MRWLSILLVVACGSQSEPVRPPPTPQPVVVTPDAAAPPSSPPTDAGPPIVSPIALPSAPDAALAKRLDAAVDKAIAEQQLVGVVVMVARDGKLVYARGAGLLDREAKLPVREDSMFRLASMTKAIVSATALLLVEQGKLNLGDPVTKYLPEFRPRLANGKEPKLTVRHLITHTSGLTYRFIDKPGGAYHKAEISDGLAEPGFPAATNLERLASVPLLFEPGSQWHYGLSIDVLGAVMEKAGGNELPSLVKEMLLRPLGMVDTMFAVTDRPRLAWPYAEDKATKGPPIRMTEPYDMKDGGRVVRFSPARIFDSASFPSGGAGLAGTARDYLIFLEAVRTGGAGVMSPETVRAMSTDQLGAIRGLGSGFGFTYGFGVVTDPVARKTVRGKGTLGWGGIYGTGFWIDPVAKLSVVMLTNVAGDTPFDRWVEAAVYAK